MATKLFLDTEFNGHRGELISIALVSEFGAEYYGVVAIPVQTHEWVAQHVIPYLGLEPIGIDTVRQQLKLFLMPLGKFVVYADWPADFEHFFSLLSGEGFMTAYAPTMAAIMQAPPREPISALPHNALEDARALRTAWM